MSRPRRVPGPQRASRAGRLESPGVWAAGHAGVAVASPLVVMRTDLKWPANGNPSGRSSGGPSVSSCGIPRPEPGICCGKTSGSDGWQVGARETPGPRGRKRRRRRGPSGPPPAAALGSLFRARGWAEPTALTPPGPARPGPSARAAPWVWVPPHARADSPAGRYTRGRERPPGLPGESSFGRPRRPAGPCSSAFHPGNEWVPSARGTPRGLRLFQRRLFHAGHLHCVPGVEAGGRGTKQGNISKVLGDQMFGGQRGRTWGKTGGQLLVQVDGCPQSLSCYESCSPHFGITKEGPPFWNLLPWIRGREEVIILS